MRIFRINKKFNLQIMKEIIFINRERINIIKVKGIHLRMEVMEIIRIGNREECVILGI
jgi:hypothetical protein